MTELTDDIIFFFLGGGGGVIHLTLTKQQNAKRKSLTILD